MNSTVKPLKKAGRCWISAVRACVGHPRSYATAAIRGKQGGYDSPSLGRPEIPGLEP